MLTACRKSVSSFLRFLHFAAASLFRSRLTRRRSSSSGLIWGTEEAVRWIQGNRLVRWPSGRILVEGMARGGALLLHFKDHRAQPGSWNS